MTTTATATAAAASTAATYVIDASHSQVGFSVRHMMLSNVRGQFDKFEGSATYDPAKPEASRVRASIDVASISTREDKRDAHLRSADFFDAEAFPSIDFESKQVRRVSDDELEILGDLSIRGTTREVTLRVADITGEQADPWGNQRFAATASTKIRRSDFGMTWNSALEAGGVLVGDEIKISIEVQLVKQA